MSKVWYDQHVEFVREIKYSTKKSFRLDPDNIDFKNLPKTATKQRNFATAQIKPILEHFLRTSSIFELRCYFI